MDRRAKEIIQLFQLSAHPEGGFFKEVYRSDKKCTVHESGDMRNWLTDIYFLLTEDDISRFHRVKHDEIWHFYEGAPLVLTEIHPVSMYTRSVTIGQPGPQLTYKHCVKGNIWQSARSTGAYSFLGCTVGPGFDFDDFEMMVQNNDAKASVSTAYPELAKYI